jgi:hypothetical protein
MKKMFSYQPRKSKHKIIYIYVWFLALYLMLLYFGERIMFFVDSGDEPREAWLGYTVVGLIILGSSGLTKMLLEWVQEMRKDKLDGNQ